MALLFLNCCSKSSKMLDVPTPNAVSCRKSCGQNWGKILKTAQRSQSPGRHLPPLPSTLTPVLLPSFCITTFLYLLFLLLPNIGEAKLALTA